MLKPTTVRVSDDFLGELLKFIKDMKLDKAAYLREILRKGFEEDRRERVVSRYQSGELFAEDVCKMLGISMWEFFDLLRKKNVNLNVLLEDWLDSVELG